MYIRTDFHIYKIKSEEIIQGEKYYNIEIRGGLNKLKAEFGKQSENLDELCDAFVYDKEGCETPQRCYQNCRDIWFDEQSLSHLNDKEILTIRGGIWTDDGFIYKVKMNENGKLVLV